MSLILNDISPGSVGHMDGGVDEERRDLARLDYYLAMIEDNKKSCRFVPDDALLALDMAGFVRGRLRGEGADSRIAGRGVSAARLALALVQPCAAGPLQ